MTPDAPEGLGTVQWRLSQLEVTQKELVRILQDGAVPVLQQRVNDLGTEVKGLRRSFYTFAFGAVAASIGFAFSVFELLKPGHVGQTAAQTGAIVAIGGGITLARRGRS
jgi:hypothetical protein